MTSKNECFVYIVLPQEILPVIAGKFVLETMANGENIGHFVYGKSYLARANAVDIDPIELKLSDKVYKTGLMKGVFGAIRDSSPDYWGRLLIEKNIGKSELSEMDYILNSPDDRAGALIFGTSQEVPQQKQSFNQMLDLEQLQKIADEIMSEVKVQGDLHTQVEQLLLFGSSMGGARPKAVVSSDDAFWIAKFNCKDDRYNNALVEHCMLKLASECGLNVCESKTTNIGGKDVLLVKRFDREKTENAYLRHRMISAMTVLKADDEYTVRDKWSYILLVEQLRKISCNPKEDSKELFKRIVFNALISNTDDHPRNHAFIADKNWKLSPAYDLTPNPMISIERRDLAMVCGNQGRFANAKNILSECHRFMLETDEAKLIINKMSEYIRNNWQKTAKAVGVSQKDCQQIKSAFLYQGFFF